jgi:hypothetical protein
MSSKPQHFAATQIPAFLVKAGKDRIGGTLNALGVETSVKISSHDSGGAYSMMEASYPPNSVHRSTFITVRMSGDTSSKVISYLRLMVSAYMQIWGTQFSGPVELATHC